MVQLYVIIKSTQEMNRQLICHFSETVFQAKDFLHAAVEVMERPYKLERKIPATMCLSLHLPQAFKTHFHSNFLLNLTLLCSTFNEYLPCLGEIPARIQDVSASYSLH